MHWPVPGRPSSPEVGVIHPVARLVPEADRRAEATEKALVALQKIGRRLPMLTLADIMSGRHDGHDS